MVTRRTKLTPLKSIKETPDKVKKVKLPTKMTLEDIEKHLVRKHAFLELNKRAGTAKVLDQLMKVKEQRQKERAAALAEDATKVKPTVLAIPMLEDVDQWQKIAAQQQEELISDTAKIEMPKE